MSGLIKTIDKIKPVYDTAYKFVLFLCKLLLIVDILIIIIAVASRYIPFIPGASWTEEVVLTCMAYMAVLSAALAIRRNAHIRMDVFDRYIPKKVLLFLDILSDVGVLILAIVMIVIGWKYSIQLGGKGSYVSMPWLSRFWMYFPVPLAGIAMLIFEIEILLNHIKAIIVGEESVNEC